MVCFHQRFENDEKSKILKSRLTYAFLLESTVHVLFVIIECWWKQFLTSADCYFQKEWSPTIYVIYAVMYDVNRKEWLAEFCHQYEKYCPREQPPYLLIFHNDNENRSLWTKRKPAKLTVYVPWMFFDIYSGKKSYEMYRVTQKSRMSRTWITPVMF